MKTRAKIGQLVRFRAGGPVLSIAYENLLDDGSYSYVCQWFEYETLRYATFPIVALEPEEGEFEAIDEELPDNEVDTDADVEAEAKEGDTGKNYH
ncbi:DUF2158 domain-containing protein [Endozoicomonas sp. SCSIO W0465]|uniref:DUF2158 domain-containing protein n=1 Tax=Endozoicomonas sp. SCSIO W0465 TaxID=2918516 RepID=UPI002075E48E|nr:DUF2158 domain-containing protein [Endozoicomonas sp. SCSIO W0465]USE37924.1 YodC family protein [Endozoicomonas sp. SCSIO W0465]